MEKVKVLEIMDFEMEVQCDGSSCKYDCTEPNGYCSSHTTPFF
ncbi:hypothetical protein ABEW60_14140 [Paenibacillus jamilae]|nr:hypothetical protein [Paenibacillus sp. LX16]